MRFKQFEICEPTFLGEPPTKDYFKYHFNVVKWTDDHSYYWIIGGLEYNIRELCFEFHSIGLRYLQDREDGLEEWLLKWCELKALEYQAEHEKWGV